MTNIERNQKHNEAIQEFLEKVEELNEDAVRYPMICLMREISVSLASIADSLESIATMYGNTPSG